MKSWGAKLNSWPGRAGVLVITVICVLMSINIGMIIGGHWGHPVWGGFGGLTAATLLFLGHIFQIAPDDESHP